MLPERQKDKYNDWVREKTHTYAEGEARQWESRRPRVRERKEKEMRERKGCNGLIPSWMSTTAVDGAEKPGAWDSVSQLHEPLSYSSRKLELEENLKLQQSRHSDIWSRILHYKITIRLKKEFSKRFRVGQIF